MTFLTLMGALLVFGFLWLVFPRAAFAAALGVIFAHVLKVNGPCEALAGIFLVCGVIFGAILDFVEGRTIVED